MSSLDQDAEPGNGQDLVNSGTAGTGSAPPAGNAPQVRATFSGVGSISVVLTLTTSLTANHLQAAALFARQAAAIEATYAGAPTEEIVADHRSYVTGSVLTSVAFLEAAINEVFDYNLPQLPAFDAVWQQLLSGRPGTPTLKKYQFALQLAGKSLFDTGDSLYQNTDVLIKLRNALIHYEPKLHAQTTASVPQKDLPELRRKLTGKFTAMNPLVPPYSHFLHEYLGHGCAAWAVECAWTFTDEFFSRMGLACPYEHVRHRLSTT